MCPHLDSLDGPLIPRQFAYATLDMYYVSVFHGHFFDNEDLKKQH